jgi:diaminohydroxyphosphoribosylaminopyrimidine deaminase/5-amino-6-(5-phosphoribosylamino)uracil reductase
VNEQTFNATVMREALKLARRGYGTTSPNPMVGAVLMKSGKIIGRGYHHRAGLPHAEIDALSDAKQKGHDARGAVMYVTLEPCSTHGRTPPCTQALIHAGVKRVVAGATDPNPNHSGRGFRMLKRAGIQVTSGVLDQECTQLNAAFNHWVVHRSPLVTVKAAMTLDGKIATSRGESEWITGEKARGYAMRLRRGPDAILVGINTVLADDPSLTSRSGRPKALRRIILDSRGRTPLTAKVVTDQVAALTTIVVTRLAARARIDALARRVNVILAPIKQGRIDLRWLLKKLGEENVTSLLVEGGGEVNASFLNQGLAQRIAFFYAPKILGGQHSLPAVGGPGATRLEETLSLHDVKWSSLGEDLLLTAALRS